MLQTVLAIGFMNIMDIQKYYIEGMKNDKLILNLNKFPSVRELLKIFSTEKYENYLKKVRLGKRIYFNIVYSYLI